MRIFVDMDNVLVDFKSALRKRGLPEDKENADDLEGIFAEMESIDGAIDAYKKLAKHHDVYILSTAPWNNPSAWSDKLEWVKEYLPEVARKRLILSHHKNLCDGDILIDDRLKRGAGAFKGLLIQFGTPEYPDWKAVLERVESVSFKMKEPGVE